MATATVSSQQGRKRIRVAWISDYPIEWMPDLPEPLRALQRPHPATWANVLLQELQARGDVEVHAIALRSRVKRSVTFRQDNTTYHVIKASSLGRVSSLFWLDTLLIRRRLRSVQPDLVHAWGIERGASLVASRLGRPYLATVQGILSWVVHVVPSVHPFVRFMARLEPIALRRARFITAESRFSCDYISQRYPSARVLHADYAPNPVFFDVTRTPAVSPLRLISVGTIGYGKGTDLLLNALGRIGADHPFELVLVGSASETQLQELRKGISRQVWERVQIKSGLTPAEMADELSRSTFMVLPTRADTGPTVVKEAAVAGVPVVGSRIGGIPDYITHGENGFLFPAGDLDALTQALGEAMSHPLFGKGSVDQQARDRVRSYLSPKRMGQTFFDAYQLVLETWNRPQSH